MEGPPKMGRPAKAAVELVQPPPACPANCSSIARASGRAGQRDAEAARSGYQRAPSPTEFKR